MRICSLFSTATELLYALGAGHSVVGRSDCCDFPPGAIEKPIVVRSRIASDRLTSRGIHEAVQAMRRRGEHQYDIDVPLLRRLAPDLVVMQELCSVCAASHPEVSAALERLPTSPAVVSVNARRFDELYHSIDALGQAIGKPHAAQRLTGRLRQEVRAIQKRLRHARARPRVWCVEWLDPLIAAGHWIPELVALAGGRDGFGRAGHDSQRMSWDEVRRYDPEVILVMPCSFSIQRTISESSLLTTRSGWSNLSAVNAQRVFAVEGSFFHRPGPRLVKGLNLMAALFHPELFPPPPTSHARRLT